MNAEIKWVGEFSPADYEEINFLRSQQMFAIEKGDANTYSTLCTDDIFLMLQGQDVVIGKVAFYQCESNLLQQVKFTSIVQIPIRVERQGDLAVEVGQQEVVIAASAQSPKDYKTHRKYCHVMRKTDQGWRFAVLMSNNCN